MAATGVATAAADGGDGDGSGTVASILASGESSGAEDDSPLNDDCNGDGCSSDSSSTSG